MQQKLILILINNLSASTKGIQVRFESGDLWLTQKAIGELFNTISAY